jgi:hypothetical protein
LPLSRGGELLVPGVDGGREDERVGVEVLRGVADDDVAAATTGPAFSRCSPPRSGSGTYAAGRPTAASSAHVIAPRADHEVGRGVGVLHLVDVADDDVERVGGVAVRHLDHVLRPGDVAAPCTPLARNAAAAPDTAPLITPAPCEPPMTISTGRRDAGRTAAGLRRAARVGRAR